MKTDIDDFLTRRNKKQPQRFSRLHQRRPSRDEEPAGFAPSGEIAASYSLIHLDWKLANKFFDRQPQPFKSDAH